MEDVERSVQSEEEELKKTPYSADDGIYIIDVGRCRVVNPADEYETAIINKGDFFGECELLKTPVSCCYDGAHCRIACRE